MFLVGGGIFVHNIAAVHHVIASWSAATGALAGLTEQALAAVCGVLLGGVLVALFMLAQVAASQTSHELTRKQTET